MDHARTAFPLRGQHAKVECAVPRDPVTAPMPARDLCHVPHRSPSGRLQAGLRDLPQRVGVREGRLRPCDLTRFPARGRAPGMTCASCHKTAALSRSGGSRRKTGARAATIRVADFRGLDTACVSCHTDPHAASSAQPARRAIRARRSRVTAFTHANQRPFFGGSHAALRCEQCHQPTGPPASPVHPGESARLPMRGWRRRPRLRVLPSRRPPRQVGEVRDAVTPSTPRSSRSPASLTPRPLSPDGQARPARVRRRATRLRPLRFRPGRPRRPALRCRHDVRVVPHRSPRRPAGRGVPHCHSSETFKRSAYTHQEGAVLKSFFAGPHLGPGCASCHKTAGRRAAGPPTPPRGCLDYRLSTTCTQLPRRQASWRARPAVREVS